MDPMLYIIIKDTISRLPPARGWAPCPYRIEISLHRLKCWAPLTVQHRGPENWNRVSAFILLQSYSPIGDYEGGNITS